jgi:hypothetical protein
MDYGLNNRNITFTFHRYTISDIRFFFFYEGSGTSIISRR